MLDFANKRIFLYDKQIDFRKGVSSLAYLIKTNYPNTDLSNCLFIFFASNKRQVKIIEIEDNSIWLYQNKLNNAKFIFPKCDTSNIKIDARQLNIILKQVESIRNRKCYKVD